jgi:hypothetical protein
MCRQRLRPTPQPCPILGSRMGAADRAQVRPSAAFLPPHRRLNCPDVRDQAAHPPACSVRIEGVRGSNPLSSTLSSTQDKARFRSWNRAFWILRHLRTAATVYASQSESLRSASRVASDGTSAGMTLLDSLRGLGLGLGLGRELEPGCVDEYWPALVTGREVARILGISGGRWRQICRGYRKGSRE